MNLNYIKPLIELVFPTHCIMCHTPSRTSLCSVCYTLTPILKNNCLQCARPILGESLHCGQCIANPPYFQQAIALWEFKPPITNWIHQLKFSGQSHRAKLFGQCLANHCEKKYYGTPLPDAIIPVPLHKKRLSQRGYNQAELIAKVISKQLNIPILNKICSRKIHTEPQATLSVQNRMKNTKGAFRIATSHPLPRSIILVDDVMTTMATLNNLAHCFNQSGVKTIHVWVCARAV